MDIFQFKIFALILYGVIFCPVDAGTSSITGLYENHKYDNGGKNNWHYVTISYVKSSNTYKWKNRAGVKWTLYPTSNPTEFLVGPDCPYYKSGFLVTKFTLDGLIGPYNELYKKAYKNPYAVGEFENHGYDNGGKNKWHYVEIKYDMKENKYTWKNKAGVTWSLYPTYRTDILRVGKDCPYFEQYKEAKVNQMGIYGPGKNEFYTRSFKNPILVGRFENLAYTGAGKNNWHYVTITYNPTKNTYIWKNRAGVKWALYPFPSILTGDTLRVDKSCPYYNNGHTSAKFDNIGVYGPFNELYTRVERFSS